MDVERVTRRFYDRFRTELTAFQKFIDGFAEQGNRDWYASLMLNRMMFVYFIQKQGFLDGDEHYLHNRLRQVQEQDGPDRFQRFYRQFLLRLFHEGLGQPEAARPPDLVALLGKVPYLNGGIFDPHPLERDNPNVNIPDAAFEQIFGFFDDYQWHLDDRPTGADNEINPDVLGYIFEKYVNQKQMGAYYTKEDITGYIARNTVIPRILEMAEKECPIAFRPDGGIWRLLQDDPDHYIYPSMGHGVTWDYSPESNVRLEEALALPDHIARGLDDTAQRGDWNQAAPEDYALPTETWRELIARRQRYTEVRDKLGVGQVQGTNDLITLNLDSERFARDVIVNSEGPELVRAIWNTLTKISVLDPACGSGAFLFAALNILEPLYSATMQAMREFLGDLETSKRQRPPKALQDFRQILDAAGQHRNERYYILKSIIVNNLYGVDIMEEAVEICRLRLFLKLAAQLESYDQIEPLPDIDFNIQAGNSLVGFTSADSVRRAMTVDLKGQQRLTTADEEAALRHIEDKASEVAREYRLFQRRQTDYGMGYAELAQSKHDLQSHLADLRGELDTLLAHEYGVDADNTAAFRRWHDNHQPFHWFVEFHGIMEQGGFDVVVGNPPYVEYSRVRNHYQARGFQTEPCGNLYAFCTERSFNLLGESRRFGFIVQAPIVSTQRMSPLRELIHQHSDFKSFATFDDRPSKLFQGMDHCRVCIVLSRKGKTGPASAAATTRYHKWYREEAPALLDLIQYEKLDRHLPFDVIPKLRSRTELSIYDKVVGQPKKIEHIVSRTPTENRVYYKITGVGHWFTFTTTPPKFWRDGVEGSSTRESSVCFPNSLIRDTAFCCLWSSLHYWLYQARTNCRDFNPSDLASVPIPNHVAGGVPQFTELAKRLTIRLQETSDVAAATYSVGGSVQYQRFTPKLAKPIIDEIDSVLAEHYGFTDEELDFIINYDIKYRMGRTGM